MTMIENDTPISGSNATAVSWVSPGAGITAGYNGTDETYRIFVSFFCGLAMYNAVELLVMIFLTFKRYSGLYFWSMLVAGAAIIPYSIGFLLKFLNLVPSTSPWPAIVLLTIGWWPMITGQAVVLWSRLHLIVSGEKGDRILRWTKWMIIIDAVIFYVPTTILTFGANGSLHTHVFADGYNVMEKIQMIGFFLQEIILSSIYIIETIKILRSSLQPETRTTMRQLILINAVIIGMDLCLLGLECASLYILETLLKGIIYSIKLKLEFAILGKLVKFVGANHPQMDMRRPTLNFVGTDLDKSFDPDLDLEDFVDLNRIRTDVTHPSQPSETYASRRRSTRPAGGTRPGGMDFEYDMARFEHREDVSTFQEVDAVPSIISERSRPKTTDSSMTASSLGVG